MCLFMGKEDRIHMKVCGLKSHLLMILGNQYLRHSLPEYFFFLENNKVFILL